MWYPNPTRIRELFDEERVRRAADAVLTYKTKEVLQLLAWAWGIVLVMVFTLLAVVRLALSFPLPHGC